MWNVHPEGGSAGLGISPFNIIRSLLKVGSGIGTALSKASCKDEVDLRTIHPDQPIRQASLNT